MTTAILIIITVILWGTAPILEKIGLGTVDKGINPFYAIAIRSFSITTILLIALGFTGGFKELANLDKKTIMMFMASGIMAGLLGMWAYFGALKCSAVSRVVPLVATYPLVAAVLSIVILGEKVTTGRIIGTILIISGVWFVK